MVDLEQLSITEIEELSREAHYNLREQLINLYSKPPTKKESLTMLQNQIASLMRMLDEYHSHLFVRERLSKSDIELSPGEYLDEYNMHMIKKYQEWRMGKLGTGAWVNKDQYDDASKLAFENEKRWKELFRGPSLYGGKPFGNHWHITASRKVAGEETWVDFGDIHTDLTITHIIASYRKGFEVRIFHGGQIDVGGNREFRGELTDRLSCEPKGIGNNGLPQIAINKDGRVNFNLKI